MPNNAATASRAVSVDGPASDCPETCLPDDEEYLDEGTGENGRPLEFALPDEYVRPGESSDKGENGGIGEQGGTGKLGVLVE